MKLIALFVLGVIAASSTALAQAPTSLPTDPIERAVMPIPVDWPTGAAMRAGATVIKWNPDFTYETLKKGTNDEVCFDKSGAPEMQKIMIECTIMENLDREAQNKKFEASGDKVKTQAMLDAAEKDGTRVKPVYGSVWYHLMGSDEEHLRMHMTIAVPGATGQSLGLPDNAKQGGVWVMNGGTTTAHLMIPGQ